jgi:hypothetical protein
MAFIGCDGIVIQDGRLLLQQREDFRTWACYFPLTALPDTLLARQRERIMNASAGLARPVVKRQGADPAGDSDRRAES